MRLDHLLSKGREEVGVLDTVGSLMECEGEERKFWSMKEKVKKENSGADALMGDTRTHAEHDG